MPPPIDMSAKAGEVRLPPPNEGSAIAMAAADIVSLLIARNMSSMQKVYGEYARHA